MEVEDEALLDEEDASNNDPTSDATDDSSAAVNPVAPDNAASNESYRIDHYISPY